MGTYEVAGTVVVILLSILLYMAFQKKGDDVTKAEVVPSVPIVISEVSPLSETNNKVIEKKSLKNEVVKPSKVSLPAVKMQHKLLSAVEDKTKDTCPCYVKEIGGHSMAIVGNTNE